MSYFEGDGGSDGRPGHIIPDPDYELLPGFFNLSIQPDATEWPTLRFRWGNESVPDGTIGYRDYPNPGIPGPNPDQTEVQIWVNGVNDPVTSEAQWGWGYSAFDFLTEDAWIWHFDTGWTIDNSPSRDTLVDSVTLPLSSTWAAVTALKPPT